MIAYPVPRRADAAVTAALAAARLVVIAGPPGAGKTTLAGLIAGRTAGSREHYLDDPEVRAAAERRPAEITGHAGLVVVDEAFRVPGLLPAIGAALDSAAPGRYLITSSTGLLGLRLPGGLPARARTVPLWPLAQGEIDGAPDGFVDAAFTTGADLRLPRCPLHRRDYVRRALRGGYARALRLDAEPRRQAAHYESYLTDLIARGVRRLRRDDTPADVRRVLGAAGAGMARPLDPGHLSRGLRLSPERLARCLGLLEAMRVVHPVPAWTPGGATPSPGGPPGPLRLLMADSGLAAHLAGLSRGRTLNRRMPVHPLLVDFVLGELARQCTWTAAPTRLCHHGADSGPGDGGGAVHGVLVRDSGEIVGITVTAADTVGPRDFAPLRRLAGEAGDRFRAGYVLHTGGECPPFGERMRALPIAALWQTAP